MQECRYAQGRLHWILECFGEIDLLHLLRLLIPQGRVLHPAFVIPIDPKTNRYLVSHVPGPDHPAPLDKYLKPFRLRSKVRIRDVTAEWDVYAAWGGAGADTNAPAATWRYGNAGAAERLWTWSGEPAPLGLGEKEQGCWDLRAGWGAAGLGRHVIVPKGEKREGGIFGSSADSTSVAVLKL